MMGFFLGESGYAVRGYFGRGWKEVLAVGVGVALNGGGLAEGEEGLW